MLGPASMPMRNGTQFNGLSNDILTVVLSYVTRPSDMVSLCLTSKRLHELTVRNLYKAIHLHLGGTRDSNMAALLSPDNIGVRHIKQVDLWHDHTHDNDDEDAVEALARHTSFAVRMMLELLPKNQLEKFRWHPWAKFSADNLALLYQRQKKLKWHEAITVDQPFDERLKKRLHFDGALDDVRDLGLWLDSRDSLYFAHELVKRVKKVNKITLRSSFDGEIEEHELNDRSTEPGLISSTVFAHLLPFPECKTPILVSELMLCEVSLRYTRDTYSHIFSLPDLKSLKIHSCRGADAFFADLSRSSKLPHNLQTLEFRHPHDTVDSEALTSVTNFLCLVSGVENLTIDITNTRALPDTKCIIRHSKTLKALNVHTCAASTSTHDDEHVYEVSDIEKITQKCTKLEQVSLAFPKRDITKAAPTKYNNFTSHILRLRNLVTLNITTWPTDTSIGHRLPRETYEAILARHAARFFKIAGARGYLGEAKGINVHPVHNSTPPPPAPPTNTPNNPTTPPPPNTTTDNPTTTTPTTTPPNPNTTSPTTTANPSNDPTTTTTTTSSPPTEDDTDADPSPLLTAHNARHPPDLLRSPLQLVAYGTTDSPHDRKDSSTTIIFAKGVFAHPDSPDCRRGPVSVKVGWCLRRYIEPRSEVLDFPLTHHIGPPCVDDEDAVEVEDDSD